jgi:D-serine deaminase-like pyridoxal phosphate-dependent protein
MDAQPRMASHTMPQYPYPDDACMTPCFVIFEDAVRHNLARTVAACGGAQRLMPHVKTHRAPWLIQLFSDLGVQAFKCATPAEVEMVLAAGATCVMWAYPAVNPANVGRLLAIARCYPQARVTGMVDSAQGLAVWKAQLRKTDTNVALRIDIDVGMGRTGIAPTPAALDLALAVNETGRFVGWHVYDGHVKGDRESRREQVSSSAASMVVLQETIRRHGIAVDIVAGGSYTFDLWPPELARYVSPGSWTYSSAQHDFELSDLEWQPAAFVLTTVTSLHDGTATLDAGSKAIAPDKSVAERFRWKARILSMSEEHTVIEAGELSVGDRVYLMPQHACTTAYLYDKALVMTSSGQWDYRAQLGCAR